MISQSLDQTRASTPPSGCEAQTQSACNKAHGRSQHVVLSSRAAAAAEQRQTEDTQATEDAEEGDLEDPRSLHRHVHLEKIINHDEAEGLTATSLCLRRHPGITSGLMKGALSVAASAYKALFTGQGPTQVEATELVSINFEICVNIDFAKPLLV